MTKSTPISNESRGLNYALARYYDSRTGTFCSADPLAGSPSDPQSWNRYPYGRNDPIDKNDPSGKHWWNWALLAGGVAAAIFAPEIDSFLGNLLGGSDAAAAGAGGAAATDGTAAATEGAAGADIGGTAGTAGAASIETTAPSVSFSLDAGGMPSGIALSTTTTVNVTAGAGPSIWTATGNALPFMGTIQMNAWYHPPSGTHKPGFWRCTFTKGVGMALGSTAADAIGIFPAAGNVFKGVQFGASIIGAAFSLFGDNKAAGLGATGVLLATADQAGIKLAVRGVEMVPVAGNIVSAGATVHDIIGKDGLINSYKNCMSGAH
jgi:RHS repeat-associated protein